MKRIVVEELFDQPGQPADEVVRCLDDLRGINRRMGGNALHAALLQRAAEKCPEQRPLELLEVASGRADVLQYAALQLQQAGRGVALTLLDADPTHFPAARDWDARLPQPRCVTGNALAMPFADESADIVSCCLFAHHLEPEQVGVFLCESLRVARTAVVINDLERRWAHLALAYLGRSKFRSRFTRYDAPVSVRRSYTLRELESMLAQTGRAVECRRAPVFRIGGILWK